MYLLIFRTVETYVQHLFLNTEMYLDYRQKHVNSPLVDPVSLSGLTILTSSCFLSFFKLNFSQSLTHFFLIIFLFFYVCTHFILNESKHVRFSYSVTSDFIVVAARQHGIHSNNNIYNRFKLHGNKHNSACVRLKVERCKNVLVQYKKSL